MDARDQSRPLPLAVKLITADTVVSVDPYGAGGSAANATGQRRWARLKANLKRPRLDFNETEVVWPSMKQRRRKICAQLAAAAFRWMTTHTRRCKDSTMDSPFPASKFHLPSQCAEQRAASNPSPERASTYVASTEVRVEQMTGLTISQFHYLVKSTPSYFWNHVSQHSVSSIRSVFISIRLRSRGVCYLIY
jgi:hypothetical protein